MLSSSPLSPLSWQLKRGGFVMLVLLMTYNCLVNFQVHAVLLLLGGCELSSGTQGVDMALQNQRVVKLSVWVAFSWHFCVFHSSLIELACVFPRALWSFLLGVVYLKGQLP